MVAWSKLLLLNANRACSTQRKPLNLPALEACVLCWSASLFLCHMLLMQGYCQASDECSVRTKDLERARRLCGPKVGRIRLVPQSSHDRCSPEDGGPPIRVERRLGACAFDLARYSDDQCRNHHCCRLCDNTDLDARSIARLVEGGTVSHCMCAEGCRPDYA
jgi:hypothetical protein